MIINHNYPLKISVHPKSDLYNSGQCAVLYKCTAKHMSRTQFLTYMHLHNMQTTMSGWLPADCGIKAWHTYFLEVSITYLTPFHKKPSNMMTCLVDNMAHHQRISDEQQSEWLVDCDPNWDQWYVEKSAWDCELNDYKSVTNI